MSKTPNAHIYEAIADERARQERLVGEGKFRHTCAHARITHDGCARVLMEEVGEVAHTLNEYAATSGEESPFAVDEQTRTDLRKELIQVAAVCVAWIEKINAEGELE